MFMLLALSAPWWNEAFRGVKEWILPVPAIPNRAKYATEDVLCRLVSRVRIGMTTEEITSIFGFSPNGGSFAANSPDVIEYWIFSVREHDRDSVSFEGTFQAGRLKSYSRSQ